MYKWYKEPLFHFLVLGSILFFISLQSKSKPLETQKHLVITQDKLNELIEEWKKSKKHPPTQKELDKLLEHYIEDEILYQEALDMKLDRNEPEIKKILIDKLKYISSSSIEIDKVKEEKLKEYFELHKENFIKKSSKTISFKHIYLNPKKQNKDIDTRANAIFLKLENKKNESNISTLGDKFYAGHFFNNMSKKELSNYFSQSFVRDLFKYPEKQWLKPIKSGYGIHIIYIENYVLLKPLTFLQVKEKVRNSYLIEQNYNAYKTLYKTLRKKYNINIEKK